MLHQARQRHIENDPVERVQPLQGQRRGRTEIERQRRWPHTAAPPAPRSKCPCCGNQRIAVERQWPDRRSPDAAEFAVPRNITNRRRQRGNGLVHALRVCAVVLMVFRHDARLGCCCVRKYHTPARDAPRAV